MFQKRSVERDEIIESSLGKRELKSLSNEEAEELCILATELCIIRFSDVKDAIANGQTYNTTQRELMHLYDLHIDEITYDPSDCVIVF